MTHRAQRADGWRALVERERERESAEARGVGAPASDEGPTCAWPGIGTALSHTAGLIPGDAIAGPTPLLRPHRATG